MKAYIMSSHYLYKGEAQRMKSLPIGGMARPNFIVALALCCASTTLGQVQQPAAPATFETLQSQALQEAETGKTEEAIRDYRRALDLRPDWKEGQWNLGTLQYEASQFAAAQATFQKVVTLAPNLGAAWALLGLSEFETKDYAVSLTHLVKANALGIQGDDEIDRVSKYHLALLLIRDGDFDQAADLLQKTFAGGQMSSQARFALGLAALHLPLLPSEVEPSKEAIIVAAGDRKAAGGSPHPDPNISSYRAKAIGSSLEDRHRWQQAMKEYTEGQFQLAADDLKSAVLANPANGTGWAMLGLSEFALKDYDNALLHLERGQQLGISGSPESLQSAKYTLGMLLTRAGQFDRAVEVLATALGTGPLDGQVEEVLGLALLRKPQLPGQVAPGELPLLTAAGKIVSLLQSSQYDAAFQQFKPLLEKYPSTPFLHYAYGTALIALSEFDEAAVQMRAEISLSPTSELPQVRLASIALRQHDPATAIAPARRAIELAPNSAEAHYLLGRASLETGDNETALHQLEIAAKLSPDSPEVHFNLAKAYAKASQPQAAERERAKFARLNEIAEAEKSRHGTQIYSGPHEAGEMTAPQTSTKPN
jgi:tetratricopeptide (TPR) repeat protein